MPVRRAARDQQQPPADQRAAQPQRAELVALISPFRLTR